MRIYPKLEGPPPSDITKEKEFLVSFSSKLLRAIPWFAAYFVLLFGVWWVLLSDKDHLLVHSYLFDGVAVFFFIILIIPPLFDRIHFTFTPQGVLITKGIIRSRHFYFWSAFESYEEKEKCIILNLKDSQGHYMKEKHAIATDYPKFKGPLYDEMYTYDTLHVPQFVLDTGKETEDWGMYFMSHLRHFR